MTSDLPESGSRPPRPDEGIRVLLDLAVSGEPDQRLKLAELLAGLRQGAFGMFLLLAILPAFIPLPGVAGALSGPLVMLIGGQMLLGRRTPWLPDFIARRGPRHRTIQRFTQRLARPLARLDRMLHASLPLLVQTRLGHMFTGAQLVVLGLLLSLPIPFTNYLFGFQLLLYALALLERDGRLMAINWAGGLAAIAFFGISSGHLITYSTRLINDWIN